MGRAGEHRVQTGRGWVVVRDLRVGERIRTFGPGVERTVRSRARTLLAQTILDPLLELRQAVSPTPVTG